MVEIGIPSVLPPHFMSLIPAQRARVNEMMEEGHIRSYTLSMDRGKLWVVMIAASRREIRELIDTFPIMPYCSAEIFDLMFHDAVPYELPRISLN